MMTVNAFLPPGPNDMQRAIPGAWQHLIPLEPPSRPLKALRRGPDIVHPQLGSMEYWESEDYSCTVRHYPRGFAVGNGPYLILGISNADESARHDWRDFQAIKNQLAGRDWEGVELYPAESRLKDPSNRFYLWCVPRGVLQWGLPGGRHVCDADAARAPQRPFPRTGDTP